MSKNPLIGLLLAAVASISFAALPPKYLGIKDFKLCLATQQSNGYRAWCLPAQQPERCPAASWQELKALTGSDRVPDCPVQSTETTPPPVNKSTTK